MLFLFRSLCMRIRRVSDRDGLAQDWGGCLALQLFAAIGSVDHWLKLITLAMPAVHAGAIEIYHGIIDLTSSMCSVWSQVPLDKARPSCQRGGDGK